MLLAENLLMQLDYSTIFTSMQHFNDRAHLDNGHKNLAGLQNPLTHSPHALNNLHFHTILLGNAISQV